MKFYRLISTGLLLLAFSCSKKDQTYTTEFIEGVKHIHNLAPLWNDQPEVSLEFVQKIGDLEAEDENYMFHLPTDVIVAENGNIYILDSGNHRIQKFDSNGKYISTIGRKGQGPGEFNSPIGIRLDSKEFIYVLDQGNHRIQVFSTKDKYLKSFSNPTFSPTFGLVGDDRILLNTGLSNSSNDQFNQNIFGLFSHEGNILKAFGKAKEIEHDDLHLRTVLTFQWNEAFIEVDEENNIFTAFKVQNRIEKYDRSGKLLFRSDRPLNFIVEYSEKTVYRNLQKIKDTNFNIVCFKFGIDNKKRLWIPTIFRQPDYEKRQQSSSLDIVEFQIFDSGGILLGKLSFPDDIPTSFPFPIKICRDRVFFVEIIENVCVYEYKIVEK